MSSEPTNPVGLPAQAISLAPRFLVWYFRQHPVVIVRNWMEYAAAMRESFSMLFLLKTLFSPWKSIKDSAPTKGFNFQAMMESLFLNMTTRAIGAVIRLMTIITGLCIQVLLLAGFVLYLAWWILFPFVLVLTPVYMILVFFR